MVMYLCTEYRADCIRTRMKKQQQYHACKVFSAALNIFRLTDVTSEMTYHCIL